MKPDECIFASTEDCPKEDIKLTCEECVKNKYYDTIFKATEDFVDMGKAFTDLFELFNSFNSKEKDPAPISIPSESIKKVHRVMTAFLSQNDPIEAEATVYRRLIYRYFKILVDEFEASEYADTALVN